jgi:hypothetical protein
MSGFRIDVAAGSGLAPPAADAKRALKLVMK